MKLSTDSWADLVSAPIGPSGWFGWFIEGGSERGWKRSPIGRSFMLSRSRYSGDGYAWNSMSDMQLGSLWGGRIFGRGVRKKGGSDEPPEPPWLRA